MVFYLALEKIYIFIFVYILFIVRSSTTLHLGSVTSVTTHISHSGVSSSYILQAPWITFIMTTNGTREDSSSITKEQWDQLCQDVKGTLLEETGSEAWYLIIVSFSLPFSFTKPSFPLPFPFPIPKPQIPFYSSNQIQSNQSRLPSSSSHPNHKPSLISGHI